MEAGERTYTIGHNKTQPYTYAWQLQLIYYKFIVV
jgi:hypothetical protein